MKTEVLGDKLPMKRFQPIYVDLSPEQEEAYSRIIAEARDKPRNRLSTLMPLFGVCAHPDLDGTGQALQTLSQNHFPKGAKLFELLDAIHSRGEKALIFANRMDIQKWLQSECRHRYGLRPDIINGAVTSSTRRLATVDNFSTTVGFNALILAPRAAGVGLNITAANHVIHYMREWNPAVENQATDRAYRLGQTRDVTVYTIICRSSLGETVEERLDRLLSKKRQLMDDFVIPVGGCEIKANELLELPS